MLCQSHPLRPAWSSNYPTQAGLLHTLLPGNSVQLFSYHHFCMADDLIIKIISFYNFIHYFSF